MFIHYISTKHNYYKHFTPNVSPQNKMRLWAGGTGHVFDVSTTLMGKML